MRRFLGATLRAHQYQVVETASAREGLAQAAGRNPEIILLDLGLPDRDGLEVTRELRRSTRTPIIVISARGQERDKVNALDLGADDYLTKPFGVPELLARVRVALRHSSFAPGGNGETSFETGDLKVDLVRRQVFRAGEAGPPYANRIQAAGRAGSKRRPRRHSPAAAAGGLGLQLRGAESLPQSVYGSAAPQARARSHAAATVSHRAWCRVPPGGLTTLPRSRTAVLPPQLAS